MSDELTKTEVNTLSHEALLEHIGRLAVACAHHPENLALLETFEREFRLERGRIRLKEALPVAKSIFLDGWKAEEL
jgi:hypothetical protein